MNKLEFNKPYLLNHYLCNVDRHLKFASLELSIALSLLPIRQMIISYYTSSLSTDMVDDTKLSWETFGEISSFLISWCEIETGRKPDLNKVQEYLNQLSKQETNYLEEWNDRIANYCNNWDKSRELDNFKNNKFSEN